MWVMLMHFREITPTRVWHYPGLDLVIANGAYGVDIFFVLSGFILSYAYANSFNAGLPKDEVRHFIINRFSRIYPVHLMTFAAMVAAFSFAAMTVGTHGIPDRYDPLTLLSSLTLTQAWIPGVQTPNMPAWSISAEWFAYLLFPALCLLICRTRWAFALYIVAGLGLASFASLRDYCLTHVLSGFLLGMAIYRIMPVLRPLVATRCSGLVIAAGVVFWAWRPTPPVPLGLLLFAALILVLTNPSDLLGRCLSLRPMLYLGEISYSIYMVHWPTRVGLRYGLHALGWLNSAPSAAVVGAYVVTSLIVASWSYHYVELPGRMLLRRWAERYGRGHPSAVPMN